MCPIFGNIFLQSNLGKVPGEFDNDFVKKF